MANFKRRRPKNRRAGCLLCKPSKANGSSPAAKATVADLRRLGGHVRRLRPNEDE
jgi:hypothetical protein